MAELTVHSSVVPVYETFEPRRIVVIVNPASRSARGLFERVVGACPPNREVRVLESPRPGGAAELAAMARDTADLVVAAGGDGTVAEVASGLLGSPTPLSILPLGSTNIIASELGFPRDIGQAARALFAPLRIVYRDVGRCGDRLFLHMAGAGMDARIFQNADRSLKRRVGWVAYFPAAVSAMREPPEDYTITVDNETIQVSSPLVLIANGGSIIHPAVRFDPAIRADDGWLDLIIFPAEPGRALYGTVSRMATVRLKGFPDLEIIRCHSVHVEATPPTLVQLDGDVIGLTPVSIEILPRAMKLAIPAHSRRVWGAPEPRD